MLLRRMSRRGARRLVLLAALTGLFLAAPNAAGVPGDPTPPVITPVYSPSLPSTGWYRGSVTLSWLVVDPESIILSTSGCEPKTYATDTPGTLVTCTAESDGGTNSLGVRVKVDRTPPTVSAVAERAPDANGWYNRPFNVSFSGSDPTSGIASCSSPTRYGGPDLASASVAGSCTATAPTVGSVTAKRGNRSAQIAWRASSDTSLVEVLRAPGRNGQGESVVYRGAAKGFLDKGLAVGRRYDS